MRLLVTLGLIVGLAIAGLAIFVGDVNNVRVIDKTTNTVVRSITVGSTGFRADEGCYDPDDQIYMISSPDADTPFASFISPTTMTVLATVLWPEPGSSSGARSRCGRRRGRHLELE